MEFKTKGLVYFTHLDATDRRVVLSAWKRMYVM